MTENTNLRDAIVDTLRDKVVLFAQQPDDEFDTADAIIAMIRENIPDLPFSVADRNGGYYCDIPVGGGFSAAYYITQCEFDLAEVDYSIVCHEFGRTIIWKGPKDQAKAAANEHHRDQIMRGLGL